MSFHFSFLAKTIVMPSTECLHRAEIRDKPVVVGGDEEARHGIVLAKNYIITKKAIIRGMNTTNYELMVSLSEVQSGP